MDIKFYNIPKNEKSYRYIHLHLIFNSERKQ